MVNQLLNSAAQEERVNEIIAAYLKAVESSEKPNQQQWLARYPEFAQWCGTELTADWHRRFSTVAVVYGHLHIPGSTVHDGVRFEEVSLGYPREWTPRGLPRPLLRPILPTQESR